MNCASLDFAVVAAVAGAVREVAPRKAVDVRAFRVGQLAEKALVAQVERQELILAVAAVLEQHAVAAVALRRIDYLPGLLDGLAARHLDVDVLAAVEGVCDHLGVQLRRRRDVDDVDVRVVAERLPAVRLAIVLLELRNVASVLFEPLPLDLRRLGAYVGERRHDDVLEQGEALACSGAVVTQPSASPAAVSQRALFIKSLRFVSMVVPPLSPLRSRGGRAS